MASRKGLANLGTVTDRVHALNACAQMVVYQDATVTVNFDSNLGDVGAGANYSETNTLTGRTIVSKFTRGPIRQGVDLARRGLDLGAGRSLINGP